MKISRFLDHLVEAIPLSLAAKDDPVGLQVMVEDRELTSISIVYEIDDRTLTEVIANGSELVISFHPLIYPNLPTITGKNRVERSVVQLIRSNISLFVLHTAFDAHPHGTNTQLAKEIGCSYSLPLLPHSEEVDAGMGRIGYFDQSITLFELADRVRTVCSSPLVRVSARSDKGLDQIISSVAMVAGSGMSFYDHAVRSGAEAFITGDIRYHAFHAANDNIPVIDPGHAESESFVVPGMCGLVESVLSGVAPGVSMIPITQSTNPVRYLV